MMKITKLFGLFLVMLTVVGTAMAGPVIDIPLIGIDPIYDETKFEPLVFLNTIGGRVLFDDPYGFYANGNIETRTNNYAFTGEQIQWRVLVWDKNGVPEKIKDVFAGWVAQTDGPIDPNIQVNCVHIGEPCDYDLATCGYPNVRRPGDQEPQETFNEDTMGEYLCTLTIEAGCHGQKWLGVKAVDVDDYSSTMQEAESWFCNPELNLYVSGDINFGALGPGEQGAATFSVENTAEAGSGTEVVLAISGKDFYDPTSSGAKCPTSNVLELQGDETSPPFSTGFWYTAVMGSHQTYGPKRIPYGVDIQDSDPIFSTSTSANQWSKWTTAPSSLVAMSPGAETTMTLHLGIPQPCNGQFTDGQITLWAWAI